MRHVWFFDQWKDIPLNKMREALLSEMSHRPRLGDLTVRELCCMAQGDFIPVGIYVFTSCNEVLYVGKTHGRSFQERMISHIDHRSPIPGSPHLAQLVQSIAKREGVTADEAVQRVLDMRMTWLPIPDLGIGSDRHKQLIASIERRLLWNGCLNPRYNSPRVTRNDTFSMKGVRYSLIPEASAGAPVPI